MKKLHLILCICVSFVSLSQNIEDFELRSGGYDEKLNFNLHLVRTSFSNEKAPFPEDHIIKGTSINFSGSREKYELGKASILYENKAIGDFLAVLFSKDLSKTRRQSTVTNGYLGHYERTWALNESKSYALNLGFHHADYINVFVYQQNTPIGNNGFSQNNLNGFGNVDPTGYYITAGPTLKFSYRISKFILQLKNSMSIPYGRVSSGGSLPKKYVEDPNFKNPYYYNVRLEALSSIGLYVRLEYLKLINRIEDPVWEAQMNRFDILFGYRF